MHIIRDTLTIITLHPVCMANNNPSMPHAVTCYVTGRHAFPAVEGAPAFDVQPVKLLKKF